MSDMFPKSALLRPGYRPEQVDRYFETAHEIYDAGERDELDSGGVRTAAALPGRALACGLATASLLAADVTAPLEVSGGRIHVATRSPDPKLIDHSPVDGDLLSKWLARLMACAPHILDR